MAEDKRISDVPHLEEVTGVEKIPVSAAGGEPRYIEVKQIVEKAVESADDEGVEASKLKTPVTLWGQEFDGSKDVSGMLEFAEDCYITHINNNLRIVNINGGIVFENDVDFYSSINVLGINTEYIYLKGTKN